MTEDEIVPAPTQTVRRPQLGKLAKAGSIAGILKLAGAGLSYLLLVAIAQVTDDRQFGYFGAAFSLANLVAFVGTVGQQSVVREGEYSLGTGLFGPLFRCGFGRHRRYVRPRRGGWLCDRRDG
jgi:hypothetical protein